MTETERIHEVEKKLKRWRKLQEKAQEVVDDAAALAFSQGSAGGTVQSFTISDKTYRGAELLAAARGDIAWVAVIQEGMDWMKEERPELYYLLRGHYGMRYMRGYRKKYVRNFAGSYMTTYHIGPTLYHQRRNEALRELAALAVQNGLLFVTRSYKENGRDAIGGKQ